MEKLDLTKPHNKLSVKAGTLIILQGETDKAFNILHSGLAEILFNNNIKKGSSEEEIIRDSLRIGLIKGEALIDLTGLLHREEAAGISIRSVSECILTSSPMKSEELVTRMQEDLPLNLKVLRNLITRIESSFYIFNNYKYLWHKYASIADSIALGCDLPVSDAGQKKAARSRSTLEEYSSRLKKTVRDTDLAAPVPWDYNLFLGRLQDKLDLYADHDDLVIDDLIDNRQFLFIKRLIQKDNRILAALFSKDEPTNRYIFNFLGETIERMLKINKKLAYDINSLISHLYSDTGWVVKLLSEKKADTPQICNFLHFLTKFSWRCRKDTLILLGRDILKEYPVFSRLKRYQDYAAPETKEESKPVIGDEIARKRLDKYKGLLQKILDFSGLPREFKDEFTGLIEALIKEEKKFGTEPELLKLRQRISDMYWQLYEVCFLKIIDSDLKGFIPGIMLHFGVIDERLLSDKELLLIDSYYAGNLYSDESIPVMTLPYYLEKIYKSEVSPSMTEMGDVFQTVLAGQKKLTKKERERVYIFEDTAEDRVRFEIRNVACDIFKVLFGNKKKALPFLCSEAFAGNMKRFFIEPESIVQTIDKYRKRDYSLFYREVLLKHQLGSDFIRKEVVPNFVFYPVLGSRAIMWQEMEGNRKDTPGRFFYPLFFSDKLHESLLTQLAYFRWELQKTIAGYNWTDPVEGGLVGIYYDYIRFFKKNPSISPEAKQRLEEFIKKTKSDKDRFARDYCTWVDFEYEGKIRLNSYARDIFYRYCPFPAAVRTQMAQKPLFKVLETKFQNRRQKDVLKMKSRIIKFEKKKAPLPEDLKNYMDFLAK